MQSSLQKLNDNPKSFRLIKMSRVVFAAVDDIIINVNAVFYQRVIKNFRLARRNGCICIAVHNKERRGVLADVSYRIGIASGFGRIKTPRNLT